MSILNFLNNTNTKFCGIRGDTREKNSPAHYCLEQHAINRIMDNRLFYNSPNGHGYNPGFPELLNQGRMPANNFSFNSIDIESSLLNIGACDLVNPKPDVIPQFKENLQNVEFFKRPDIIKETRFVPLLNQRPFICSQYS
tara:strand:- start:410 stop:829 length:420 start_codon:yes stop_codon:yes gene_type:complete